MAESKFSDGDKHLIVSAAAAMKLRQEEDRKPLHAVYHGGKIALFVEGDDDPKGHLHAWVPEAKEANAEPEAVVKVYDPHGSVLA